MKSKLLILFLCCWSATFGQSVPNTTTFSFWDVATAVYGDHNSGRNLVSAFADATSAKFDPAYSGSKNSLLNFRNYGGTWLPVLTTSAVTGILRYSATGGGNITSDGGLSITERGVCWATYSPPTTANGKSSSGTGTGSFTSALTSLSQTQLYYVRAYAINALGTAYGNEVSFTTAADPCTLNIGDTYGGGKIFYFLQPGDTGYDANVCHGLIVSSNLGLVSAGWGCYGTAIGTSTLIGTGQANTNAIIAGCSDANIAARICDNLTENGFTDWYLPSQQEAARMWNITYTTDSGKAFWASSEDAGNPTINATAQYESSTWASYKSNAYNYVRAIRSF